MFVRIECTRSTFNAVVRTGGQHNCLYSLLNDIDMDFRHFARITAGSVRFFAPTAVISAGYEHEADDDVAINALGDLPPKNCTVLRQYPLTSQALVMWHGRTGSDKYPHAPAELILLDDSYLEHRQSAAVQHRQLTRYSLLELRAPPVSYCTAELLPRIEAAMA